MHIMYFTERPYRDAPNDEIIKNGYFGLPNRLYDSKRGSELLNEYLDEKVLAEQLGFDGVMLNEHHDTAFCMGSVMNVEASILARDHRKGPKIVLTWQSSADRGKSAAAGRRTRDDRYDLKGRLVSGWVRGAGSEQFATNANPGFNREYFNEAHDLVVRAWTEPGPWRYEGKHFHYRFVDPWALPLQKPHPPIWIPGLLSPETVIWCAQHRYPYVALATFLEPTVELWNIYRDAAAKEGYQVGPENFGYLQKIYVAETEEKAREIAKYDMFGGAGIGIFAVRSAAVDVPAGIQLERSDPAHSQAVHRSDESGSGVRRRVLGADTNDNIAASQVEVRAGAWQQGEIRDRYRRAAQTDFRRVPQSRKIDAGDLRDAENSVAQDSQGARSVAPRSVRLLAE